ncbi:MAG TPA: ankyrin repeat domain-containing protein [Terracidiphilus sp.]|jgi:ankyrin repeat protein
MTLMLNCVRFHRALLLLSLVVASTGLALAAPIHDAARKGDVKKIQEILASDPKAVNAQDSSGDTPLHQAALHAQYKAAEALIAAGADVNMKNSYPPFLPEDLGQFFSSSNHTDPVSLLHTSTRSDAVSTHGFTEEQIRNNGYTPLSLAEFASDHNKMAQLLIAHSADVNLRGITGTTPLFWAVMRGQKEDVKLLLDHGADPNLANAFGDTPLICAVQLGYLSLVQPLVEKGADVNAQNQGTMRALGYAMQKPEDDSIVDYLKKHGAHQ